MLKNIISYCIVLFVLLSFPEYSYSWTSISNWNSSNEDGWHTWDSAGAATANITFNPTQPDGSQKVVRITIPAGTSSNSGLQIAGVSRKFSEENEMWAVHYLYYPSNYIFHPIAEKISGWIWPSSSTNNLLLAWQYGRLVMAPQLGWMGYKEFTSNTGYNPSQVKNHWYKFKEHVKMNTPGISDGVYELWVDDHKVMSYNNVPYRASNDSSGFTVFRKLLVWGGQGGNITLSSDMYLYYGTSIVSSRDIGSKEQPMPPTKLQLNN